MAEKYVAGDARGVPAVSQIAARTDSLPADRHSLTRSTSRRVPSPRPSARDSINPSKAIRTEHQERRGAAQRVAVKGPDGDTERRDNTSPTPLPAGDGQDEQRREMLEEIDEQVMVSEPASRRERNIERAKKLSLKILMQQLQIDLHSVVSTEEEHDLMKFTKGRKEGTTKFAHLAKSVAEAELRKLGLLRNPEADPEDQGRDKIKLILEPIEETKARLKPALLSDEDNASLGRTDFQRDPKIQPLTDVQIEERRVVTGYRWIEGIMDEEEITLLDKKFERIITEANKARAELVTENQGLVLYFAKYLYLSDDEIQEGQIGLISAADKFDWTRGYDFSTYATSIVRGKLKNAKRDARIRGLPTEVRDKIPAYYQAKTDLLNSNGADSDEAIAEASGLMIGEVAAIRDYFENASSQLSTDAPIQGREGDFLGDVVEDRMYRGSVSQRTDAVAIRQALEALPERQRNIILARYYENMTQQDTGEVIGASQIVVSRQERMALTALKRLLFPDRVIELDDNMPREERLATLLGILGTRLQNTLPPDTSDDSSASLQALVDGRLQNLLTPLQYDAVKQVISQGISRDKVANSLGLTESAIEDRLRGAEKKLLEHLE